MKSSKNKLPKGRSYPLKPSTLEAAMTKAGLAMPVELTRWDEFDAAFEATFYPAGTWPKELAFWVRCRAVASEHAAELRQVIETEAIPQFIAWAKEIESLDARWPRRRERQRFKFAYPILA